ncbi:MAG TPA: ABC transporter permease [Blastocatellia bacterium]|nr:ABC transporter permease [Blastocatellia bacterium]
MRPTARATDEPTISPEGASVSSRAIASSHSWQRILAVARACWVEARRDRFHDSLLLFALMVIAAALLLGQISVGQERKILIDVGLSAIRIFGALLAIFLGLALTGRDIEQRTVYMLLSKPLGRGELLLGRFVGGAVTLGASVTFMTAAVLLALTFLTRSVTSLHAIIVPAAFLLYLQALLVLALALLFATFSTPVLSAILTFVLFLIGHLTSDFAHLAETVDSPGVALLCRMLYYTLPNFQNFNFITAVAHGQELALSLVGKVSLYAILYGGILLLVAVMIFERREFR